MTQRYGGKIFEGNFFLVVVISIYDSDFGKSANLPRLTKNDNALCLKKERPDSGSKISTPSIISAIISWERLVRPFGLTETRVVCREKN